MSAKISIIVPVYNIEKYIVRCIESILNQTYRNLEIILVDDGSTDSSGSICDEYAKKDDRIVVIHKVNGGLSDARNAGLKVVTGDYIGYVDGDDWIDSTMYEDMLSVMEAKDIKLSICRYKKVFTGETIDNSSGEVCIFDVATVLDIHINEHPQYVIHNSVWSRLFKREIVEGIEFPKGQNSEDIVYSTKALLKCDKVAYFDRAYYNYVCDRDGSIMNEKKGERMLRDEIPFFKEQIRLISEAGLEGMALQASYRLYRRMIYYYTLLIAGKDSRVYADRLATIIKSDKSEIKRVYSEAFVKRGDVVRMKLFLHSPKLYAVVTGLYDKYIIPARTGHRG